MSVFVLNGRYSLSEATPDFLLRSISSRIIFLILIDLGVTSTSREFDTLKSKIFDRVRSELFFLSNLFSIFVVYISKYCKYETCN